MKILSAVSDVTETPLRRRPIANLGEISAATVFAAVLGELDRKGRTSAGTGRRYDGFMRAVELENIGAFENTRAEQKSRRRRGKRK